MEINAFVLTFTVCFSTVIVTVLGKIVNILLFILHLFLRQFVFTWTVLNMFSNVTFEPNWWLPVVT